MNISTLNSAELNASLSNNTGFKDVLATLSVNTNPVLATFKEVPATLSVAISPIPGDLLSSLSVSTYKWLTPTLLTAQQQSALRPYFKCQIVDDTIQPDSILTPPGVPINGDVVTAPDGNLLAAGADGTGRLCFWKVTNPDNPAQWATPTAVLASSYLNNFNATIAVSTYINGTYSIDIYYAINNSGNLNFVNQHSNDGGVTWSSSVTLADPGILSATSNNFYMAASAPILQIDGTISRMLFYIKLNATTGGYDLFYQLYQGTGSIFSSPVSWNAFVNPSDLIIHSFDVFHVQSNNTFNIVMSAYYLYESTTPVTNYGIYTVQLNRMTNGVVDHWTAIKQVFVNTSTASTNLNNFTFPKISYDGKYYRILCKALIVTGVQSAQLYSTTNVGTQVYYYLFQSPDFKNFSYPAPILFSDGTIFGDNNGYRFIEFQTTNFYIAGNGLLWKYDIHNIVADVTNNVLSYDVSEAAGSAAQITVTIGNQNNQWYGTSPTLPGAAAIAKNMKIYLDQGYYNANGVPEAVPRSIFYIDDIEQQITSSTNDLVLSGRDLYKNLKSLSTKYAYNFTGVNYYTDAFDGTTLSNWNQLSGTWEELGQTSFALRPTGAPATDAIITHQIEVPNNSQEAVYCIFVNLPLKATTGAALYIFPYYQDSSNNLMIKIDATGTSLEMSVIATQNGVQNIQIGNQAISSAYSGLTIPILIHRFNYTKYTIAFGSDVGNTRSVLDPGSTGISVNPAMLNFSGLYEFDINVSGTWQVRNGVFAVGCLLYTAQFQVMKHIEYGQSQSVQDLVESIGTLSGIFSYRENTSFNDDLPLPYDFNYDNVPLIENGFMRFPVNSNAIHKTYNLTDNEVEFRARCAPSNPSVGTSMNFFFRTSDTTTGFNLGYIWNIAYDPSQTHTSSRFLYRVSTAKDYLMNSSSNKDWLPSTTFVNNLNIDLTQWHTYRLVTVDGWMFGFIDNQLVIAWFDSQTSSGVYNALLSGGIGFGTDANTTMDISYVRSKLLWNQIQSFSISPSDEGDTDLLNLLQTYQAWMFSNLLGQCTTTILNPSDPSTYTYHNGILQHSVDDSDKEYYNQVTVYGTNVSAIAQDAASISATGKVRDYVVIDYKITNYNDALTRAQQELINAEKYNAQNTPTYPMNVGAELFDVITIVNTGDNSSGVNGTFRTYNEDLSDAGSSGSYGIVLEAGTL